MQDLLSKLKKGPLIFDGAMGTMIEARRLSSADFGSAPDCNPVLNLTRPDVIESIHKEYLKAGADIITTNTFGASSIALGDHNLSTEVSEINTAAVRLARKAAESFSVNEKQRFVAGELGPTSKLPTLGHILFRDMHASYVEQAKALLNAGVDALLIATSQDILQTKAAAAASRLAMEEVKIQVPLFVSVTIESNGRMLLGTDIIAALAAIEPYGPSAFGINCATGPEKMEEHLRALALHSPFHILCRPNAGLPENINGKTVYSLNAKGFAAKLSFFAKEIGLSFVGGCCGTTPEYISELADLIKDASEKNRKKSEKGSANKYAPKISSLFSAFDLDQEPKPFLIAEQTNANGSKKFRDLLLKSDYDAMVSVAKEAAKGAHALDVCVAYAGRDEAKDLTEIVSRLAKSVDIPIMIDSTNPEAIEAALSILPGRCIVNSINLEDGGKKARRILGIARTYGAAVVCLTVSENGLCLDGNEKAKTAKRLYELAKEEGLRTEDLFFDVLTLTVASGDVKTADAALKTLEGIKKVKKEIKGARVSLGVSNVSFGLSPRARRVVTSIFFDMSLKAGLDAAIINPAKILRLSQIPPEETVLASNLINNKNAALTAVLKYYETAEIKEGVGADVVKSKVRTLEESIKQKVLEGDKSGLETIIEDGLKKYSPSRIINELLLPAMQEVGELFGAGKLPLPFVLQSAETMRLAIDILGPKLKADETMNKGTMVLATVRGDVHDIGKNLVDIILSNNGFKVVNLGIRQPAASIIQAAREHNAKAIGLSGLLVSSTEVMREDLESMKHQGIDIPVLVGGAALTKKFVESTLQKFYSGKVYYCEDAFAGLKAMRSIIKK